MVTDNYYCLIENPMKMDFWKLLTQYGLGRECISGCLYMDIDRPQKVQHLSAACVDNCFRYSFILFHHHVHAVCANHR